MAKQLILIFGDQLSPSIAALRGVDKRDAIVLLCEIAEEITYVPHHKKKLIFILSAMRHFAEELRGLGWHVEYVRLDDPQNTGTFLSEIQRAVRHHAIARVITTKPGEYRLLEILRNCMAELTVEIEMRDDDRFICSQSEFASWANARSQLRMEYFYREMRRKTQLLMNEAEPVGGQWNFDHDNRKPAKGKIEFPVPQQFAPDTITQDVIALVETRFEKHFGDIAPFWFATTRAQAEVVFEYFLKYALPRFGDFQDAMLRDEKFLFHSLVSLYLNNGLLDPLAVCRAAEAEYKAGRASLNSVEGFIRQIIGWREYIRGIYWLKMPEYRSENYLEATRPLPWFYWSAQTKMQCVQVCVTQTRQEAYAHHIQRLMVTGNFALLAGIDPHQLHEWYLAVYADAYEWVELPNTIGMSQFADGGLLASKPYVSSGAYIDRMSDYCKSCSYDVNLKNGANACPFNYLYWDFLTRHDSKFRNNPRMAQMYHTYDRLSDERKSAIGNDAKKFLNELE